MSLKTIPGRCSRTWPKKKVFRAHSVHWAGNAGICLNCGKGFLKRVR